MYEHSNSSAMHTSDHGGVSEQITHAKQKKRPERSSVTTGKKNKRDLFGEIDSIKEMMITLVGTMGKM